MFEDLVTDERIAAGADYLSALEKLGFRPDGALWSMRIDEPDTLELSIFSGVTDRVGTRTVFDALFKAYDLALTPASFDPWQVGLYSPDHLFTETVVQGVVPSEKDYPQREVRGHARMETTASRVDSEGRVEEVLRLKENRVFLRHWIYRMPSKKKSNATDSRRAWDRFERTIAEAA